MGGVSGGEGESSVHISEAQKWGNNDVASALYILQR